MKTYNEIFNYKNLQQDLINRNFTNYIVIGDVHGMTDDFKKIINQALKNNQFIIQLGDIVDYGPDSFGCLKLMHDLVIQENGIFLIGNHERKLEKYFSQKREGNIRIKIKGGIVSTINQLNSLSSIEYEQFEEMFASLMRNARHHIIIGKSLFVHGSATKDMWNLITPRLKGYNETRAVFGQIDKNNPRRNDGFPNRIYDWANDIPNEHIVFVGHDILDMTEPFIINGTNGGQAIFVDTGSGKGGILSSVIKSIDKPI